MAHALLSPPGRQVTAPLHLVAAPAFCSLNNTWHSKLLVRSKGRLVQWLFRMYFLSSTAQGRHRPATTPSGLGRADLRRRVTRHRRTIARLSLGRPSPNAALLRALSRITASCGGRAWCVADIFKGFFVSFFSFLYYSPLTIILCLCSFCSFLFNLFSLPFSLPIPHAKSGRSCWSNICHSLPEAHCGTPLTEECKSCLCS